MLGLNGVRGRYSGIASATRYRQRNIQGTLNDQATGGSTFTLFAGHTQRTTHLIVPSNDPQALANEGSNSAFTGSLNYHRQLSVKTGVTVSAFRDFRQYDAGVNTTVGTGFTARITWAATAKVSTRLDSQYTWSNIEGLLVAGTPSQRKDLVRNYTLGIDYLATRHLSLRTYATRHIRHSNGLYAQFNNTSAGLELMASFD